jgi:hypothetical protein
MQETAHRILIASELNTVCTKLFALNAESDGLGTLPIRIGYLPYSAQILILEVEVTYRRSRCIGTRCRRGHAGCHWDRHRQLLVRSH